MPHHKTQIQIRFGDIDMLGHVNNAKFLSYFEQARISYFDEVIREEIDWRKQGIILAKAVIDFKRPLLLHDKIFIETWCSRLGTKSFDMSYSILLEKDQTIVEAATGLTVMVCFDYEKNSSIPVPESWKRKVELYESGK